LLQDKLALLVEGGLVLQRLALQGVQHPLRALAQRGLHVLAHLVLRLLHDLAQALPNRGGCM